MFHLKYSDLRSEGFMTAMAKLENATGFKEAKTAYDVGAMVREIADALVNCQNEYVTLLRKYSILDGEGKFVPIDGKPDTYQIIPEKFEEWKKVGTEFLGQTVAIHRHKISIDSLSPCGLSPRELTALTPVLSIS